MEITIPLVGDPQQMSLTTGKYRMYGKAPWYVPDFLVETYVDIVADKTIEIQDFIIEGENWQADVIIHDNSILVLSIVGIISLGLVFGIGLTILKVVKIVDVDDSTVAVAGVGIIGLLAWKFLG